MDKNILVCSEKNELVVEHLYTVENYYTFKIQIRSGFFAGASSFCMPKDKVWSIIEELSRMYNDLKGSCEIRDYDSDAYIIFEMVDKIGHVCIYGQIGGTYEDHFMRFKYTIDQTVLVNLEKLLKKAM